jgi:hypothetical protein
MVKTLLNKHLFWKSVYYYCVSINAVYTHITKSTNNTKNINIDMVSIDNTFLMEYNIFEVKSMKLADAGIKNARELAAYVRDQIDQYNGQTLPSEFCSLIQEIIGNPVYCKMMYKGLEFSATFKIVLRDYRLQRIEEIVRGNKD